jgi:hypothetical protein
MSGAEHEAPHSAIFSNVLSFGPHTPLSTLFANTIFVLPLVSETKFHPHIKQQGNYNFAAHLIIMIDIIHEDKKS